MRTRRIGELEVSVVGMGCNQLGLTCDRDGAAALVDEAIGSGIRYFDIADEYGRRYWDESDPTWGRAEEYLGHALRGRRHDVVIATKFGVRPPTRPERGGASAPWIRRAVDDSLRRLQTDYIDLYQLHVPDPVVPIGETLGALHDLVVAGKVRVIGCCNLTREALEDAHAVAAELGITPFASVQAPLNIFSRGSLVELMPACEALGLAFIPYYPLASGVLTGKYRRDAPFPADTRLVAQLDAETRDKILGERTFARLDALEAYATARGHTLIELAFAWLLAFPAVATVIAGIARPGQATSNAAAATWQLDGAERDEIIALVAGV
jgi:aryl-alcohol dehydrogenase-like predicted oxidoreductase